MKKLCSIISVIVTITTIAWIFFPHSFAFSDEYIDEQQTIHNRTYLQLHINRTVAQEIINVDADVITKIEFYFVKINTANCSLSIQLKYEFDGTAIRSKIFNDNEITNDSWNIWDFDDFEMQGNTLYVFMHAIGSNSAEETYIWMGSGTYDNAYPGRCWMTASSGGDFTEIGADGSFKLYGKDYTGPTADFYTIPSGNTFITNETIHFYDASIQGDGYIVNWTWDFGDGSYSYEQNPTHQYKNKGNYTVKLTVTDSHGLSDTTNKIITIKDNQPPQINEMYLKRITGSRPYKYELFLNVSDETHHIAEINISWGDGSFTNESYNQTTYEKTIYHCYTEGEYFLIITVYDDTGLTTTTNITITVETTGMQSMYDLIPPVVTIVLLIGFISAIVTKAKNLKP